MVRANAGPQGNRAFRLSRALGVVLMGVAALSSAQTSRKLAPADMQQVQPDTLLDLNTATLNQLKGLPGMGVVYARRIIEGRPYTAKHQLLTRGILPQEAYDKMKNNVVAHHLAGR